MVCLWFPRGTWMAALTLRLMVLSPPLAFQASQQERIRGPGDRRVPPALRGLGRAQAAERWSRSAGGSLLRAEASRRGPLPGGLRPHFLEQVKAECHFTNGTERVRFLERHVYNWAVWARFDSDVGEFVAVTSWGGGGGGHRDRWNPLDSNFFCFVLFFSPPGFENGIEERKNGSQTRVTLSSSLVLSAFSLLVEPVVTVYPAKTQPLQHHNLLVCSVNGFYPGHTEVRWFRNGQEEESGVVSTGLIQNGDWTFQILVMLETIPQSGEVYSCQVEHPSLTSPVTVEWRSQSECTQSKMLSGIGGLVLGLLFLGVGLFIHFRNQKAHSGLQPTGLRPHDGLVFCCPRLSLQQEAWVSCMEYGGVRCALQWTSTASECGHGCGSPGSCCTLAVLPCASDCSSL
ncbi:H-2 class II histocompatibility antigen, E-S beta chain-like [Dugong dugon]